MKKNKATINTQKYTQRETNEVSYHFELPGFDEYKHELDEKSLKHARGKLSFSLYLYTVY